MNVYDCIMFAGEMDLLEIRLNELDPLVDRFFICESLEPHGAAGKRERKFNLDKVKDFSDKIEYVRLDNLKPEYTDTKSGWERENYHRNVLFHHLVKLGVGPEDIILNCDADEIPRPQAIAAISSNMPDDRVIYFDMDLFYYNVTCKAEPWRMASIGKFKVFQKIGGLQAARAALDIPLQGTQITVVHNGGWHFSSFFDIKGIRNKLKSFAHSSDAAIRAISQKSDKELKDLIARRQNIFRPGETFAQSPANDSRLPHHFLWNLKRFEHFTA